ncbi:helix-turn-helix domain-containing protein [Vibrio sp. HI00D65]|uniref:helix-turn-helix domain-containing protein n=1 Tax=Vibrio sp. HI00D65 TaxID=1822216 RepID=UPI001E3E7668|nr:helix-turn-helix domain-containing protein [Vibrio sp. HI00D65]
MIDLPINGRDNLIFQQPHSHSMDKDNKIISHKAIQKHLQIYLEPMLLDKAQNTDVSWIMAMVKDEVFKAVIVHTRGNQTKAAKLLGISRSNFAVKIKDTASQRQGR